MKPLEPHGSAGSQGPSGLVVISPVRDEAETILCTLASVLTQGVRPDRWVIVDDGSGEETRALLELISFKYDFISLVSLDEPGERQPGSRVVRAMNRGLQALSGVEWEFLGKLDGDVQLPSRYYRVLLEAFEEDPRLGIASGTCLAPAGDGWRLEKNAPYHTRGPCKVWRRACFEEIGGLQPTLGWDGLDGYSARMKGWSTRSMAELEVLHFRPTHAYEGRFKGAKRSGRGAYKQHFSPVYLAARSLVHLFRPPYLLGGLGIAAGYLEAWLSGQQRPDDPELVRHIRDEQARRLWRLLTGRGDTGS